MWVWILVVAAAAWAGFAWMRRHRRTPDGDFAEFVKTFSEEIRRCGPEYEVRCIVPDSLTMVVSVRGQEVPVPAENIFRHYLLYPEQILALARQLLTEIEELGLERPEDRPFADAAMQILPQVCRKSWVFENAPAFGDAALVHRELGPDLVLCYVIDDPFSILYVCNAHLRIWGRSEPDLFHLATQNLRRQSGSGIPLPQAGAGPVRVRSGDGYDAARVLLLDPTTTGDLVIAMPERDTLYLGREADLERMESLLVQSPGGVDSFSTELFRLENQRFVPVNVPDPVSID